FGGGTPFTTGSFTGTPSDLPNVDFAASDAALSAAQISSFTSLYGYPIVQIPTMGTPITIPFNISSKTTNGSVTLTNDDVCGIFSGKITNWSGVSTHPTTAAIKVAYRADGSGTSFLLTQHLAATCTTGNSSFSLPIAATTTFANLFSTVPSTFTGVTGSPGVQAAVLATAGAVGYLSPDFTQIAQEHNGDTDFSPVAAVGATAATAVTPTRPNTTTALTLATIPGEPSNTTGVPTVTTDPTHWVPVSANPTSGYPIVGYTTWDLAQDYKNATIATGLTTFLTGWYGSTTEINNRGFVAVPAALNTAIVNTFLSGTGSLAIKASTLSTAR
ncbi:MAG TPA: substrate-binding domain-containing protein, partial [Rhodopila sp.]